MATPLRPASLRPLGRQNALNTCVKLDSIHCGLRSIKRTLCFALALLFCALLAWGVDFAALKPQGFVSDFSGVIDAGARVRVEQYLTKVEQATGAEIAIVTLPTLAGEPVEDVANALFRKWGIGKKGKDEGILLLLVTQDRRSRLEVGYGLEPLIPDGFAGSVLREMRPALRENQYGDAVMAAAQVLGSRIAEAKGVSLDVNLGPRRAPRSDPFPWPIVLGGIFLLFWILGAGGRGRGGRGGGRGIGGGFLPGMIIGNMMGRSLGGGRGGGGFGGYDSGGGFGGFGGGDSGGGGASGNW